MAHDDDLDQGDEDALVRALRAPGSASELADQERFVTAFRAQRATGSLGRLAGRFGIGATTIVTTIALSGGVAAAAYTQSLPDPVQRFAHEVLGPVGVPAAPPARPAAKPAAPDPVPAADPTDLRTPSASSTQTDGPRLPLPTSEVAPTGAPTLLPTPVEGSPLPPLPTPEPTSSVPPKPVPTALSAVASSSRVGYGSAVTVSGVLTAADGKPLRNRVIRLAGRSGGKPWARLAVGRTDAQGQVSLTSPELLQSTSLRLSTRQKLYSPVLRVAVVPVLEASASNGSDTTTITVTARGGTPGDTVVAYRRQGNELVRVGKATLDAGGTAVITLATPKRAVRIVLRLPQTGRHAKVQTVLTIRPDRPERNQVDPPPGSAGGRVED